MILTAFMMMTAAVQGGPTAGIERIKADMERDCRRQGGRPMFVPDAVSGIDINGDGERDYLLNAQGFQCPRPGAARDRSPPDNGHCIIDRCNLWLVVSQPGGASTIAWQGAGFNAMPWEDEGWIELQSGSTCRQPGCTIRLSWQNGRIVETFR